MFEIKKLPYKPDEVSGVVRQRTKLVISDGEKKVAGYAENDADLQRTKLSFQSTHLNEELKATKHVKPQFVKGELSLKYAEMAKIEAKGNKLHDAALFGNVELVKDLVEQQGFDINCVNGDLETALDIARKGKHLCDKAGHGKAAANHDGVVSFLSQRNALTYEEVVVKKKENVEIEMEKDQQRLAKRRGISILMVAIFVIVLIIGKPAHVPNVHNDDL